MTLAVLLSSPPSCGYTTSVTAGSPGGISVPASLASAGSAPISASRPDGLDASPVTVPKASTTCVTARLRSAVTSPEPGSHGWADGSCGVGVGVGVVVPGSVGADDIVPGACGELAPVSEEFGDPHPASSS